MPESSQQGGGSEERGVSADDFTVGTCSHLWSAWGHIPPGLDPGTRRRQPLVFIIPLVAWYLHPSTQKTCCKRIIHSLEQFSCGGFLQIYGWCKTEAFRSVFERGKL